MNSGITSGSNKRCSQILAEIKRLHIAGEPLNIPAVKRFHPDLLERVYSVKPFWGWAAAIAEAGLEYRRIHRDLLETVKCQLCGKEYKNLNFHLPVHEVTSQEYLSSFPGEFIQSEELRARRTPSLLSKHPILDHWEEIYSKEYILDRLAALSHMGLPLNDGYWHANDRAFEAVVCKYFNSWDSALKAAGLDPDEIRLQDRRLFLQRDDVLAGLQRRKELGLPLNSRAVYDSDLPLANAARRLFGSYSAALLAAGIDPALQRLVAERYTKADKNRLLGEIRKTAAIPEGIKRAEAINDLRSNYGKMVKRLFSDSWPAAAKAARVDFRAIHPKDHRDFSSKEKILLALIDRLESSKSVTASGLRVDDSRLYHSVRKYFPNYYDCYVDLGLPASAIPQSPRYASRKDVLSAINSRAKLDLGLRVVDLVFGPKKGRDSALYESGKRLFGSWPKALLAAGIANTKKRPKGAPSAREILRRLYG